MRKFVFVLSLAFLSSCNSGGNTSDKIDNSVEESTQKANEEKGNSIFNLDTESINETIEGMQELIKAIEAFKASNKEDRNYAMFAEELSLTLDELIVINKKRPENSELMIMLDSINGRIMSIKNAPSYEEADSNIDKIEQSVDQFFKAIELDPKPV